MAILFSLPRLFAIAFLLVLSGFLFITHVPEHLELIELERKTLAEIEAVRERGGLQMADPDESDLRLFVYEPLRKVYVMYLLAVLALIAAIVLLYWRPRSWRPTPPAR